VKAQHPHIPRKQIEEFIKEQTLQQTYTTKKFKGYFKIVSPPKTFQIDLIFKEDHTLLIFVDILSRKMFLNPIKNKTLESITKGVKDLLKDIGEVKGIQSDDEFNKETIKEVFSSKGINYSSVVSKTEHLSKGNKLGIVDTATRTIKRMINKYQDLEGTTKFIDALPELVEIYNNTPHNSLKSKTPDEVYEDEKLQLKLLEEGRKMNSKLESSIDIDIGDYVRKSNDKSKFEKEKKTFTKEIFVVYDKVGFKCQLLNADGEIDDRLYKYTELLKLVPTKAQAFSVVEALDKHYGKKPKPLLKRARDEVEEARKEYKKAKRVRKRLRKEGIDAEEFSMIRKSTRSQTKKVAKRKNPTPQKREAVGVDTHLDSLDSDDEGEVKKARK
jgi:hypothetical protein